MKREVVVHNARLSDGGVNGSVNGGVNGGVNMMFNNVNGQSGSGSSPSGSRGSPSVSPPGFSNGSVSTSEHIGALISAVQMPICPRCGEKVYQVDRVGPLKDTYFHKNCFRCSFCGSQLSLRTYIQNQLDPEDKRVYCNNHVPRNMAGHIDELAFGIRQAMSTPKRESVNEQIRGSGEAGHLDAMALGIRTGMAQNKPRGDANSAYTNMYVKSGSGDGAAVSMGGRFDSTAMHIKHAMAATELQRQPKGPYTQAGDPLKVDYHLQTELEALQRQEEDEMYKSFAEKRRLQEQKLSEQLQEEWEKSLEALTRRFENDLGKKKYSRDEIKRLTLKHDKQKRDLENQLTLKREREADAIKRKLTEYQRAETLELVEKHSSQMLGLILKEQTTGGKGQEAVVEAAPEVQGYQFSSPLPPPSRREDVREPGTYLSKACFVFDHEVGHSLASTPMPPPPMPPLGCKADLYQDPAIFEELDQQAINVAMENQATFTDLVRQLIRNCYSDVEKARAIFRWITVKNLNVMEFNDQDVNADTPMGLLRGIKHGTESYHVLFKRLCSFAGLHCVVIRGYSKSAGYLPGMKFEDKRFRNTWNAVFLDGSWRFVQCNWGARHLVNAKDAPKPGDSRGSVDNLRYEYDDHYFLTDPDHFIYEFFPKQKEWQLLREPLSLDEFEALPFVRSLFFKYQLRFADTLQRSVLSTDRTGAATLTLVMAPYMVSSLVFHYNLRLVEDEREELDGVNMRRYVMQTLVGNSVIFKVHTPAKGQYILDVFANLVSAGEYMTGQPMRFKSVCKMRITCDQLERCMVPLPNCASGEWGPLKAYKLFGLIPLTHEDAVITTSSRDLEVRFRMSHPLSDFMTSLHQNQADEKALGRCVSRRIQDDLVTFRIQFPEDGQYGLDIYTRETLTSSHNNNNNNNSNSTHNNSGEGEQVPVAGEKHLLTHCCKYLINVRTRR